MNPYYSSNYEMKVLFVKTNGFQPIVKEEFDCVFH